MAMKPFKFPTTILASVALVWLANSGFAGEEVTIPKARLEELERKAGELEKLKQELNKSQGEREQLKQEKEKAEAEKQQLQKAKDEAEKKAAAESKAAAEAKATAAAVQVKAPLPYAAPPMASLPPLKEGEVVSAMDLMGHYAADARAAAGRYEKKRVTVEGEIVGFSKPMFVRPYKIHLKTGDAVKKVFCTLYPPDQYKAVYPAKNGMVLTGLTSREAEVTLFKVGQTVIVEGKCTGADDTGVHLGGCAIRSLK